MKFDLILHRSIPVAAAVVAVATMALWLATGPDSRFKKREPGADGAHSTSSGTAASTVWKGQLILSNGTPANSTNIWGQFRGPNRDGISTETIPLARNWPEGGPKVLWSIDVGEGYAGAAIWKGRVLLLDYDVSNRMDALRSLSMDDGREIWRYTYPNRIKRNHGFSRTIPVVTDAFSISIGPMCNVVCVDPASGQFKWQLDMVREFGTEMPEWYAGQCPFVDGSKLILGAGGTNGLVAAVDVNTGNILWRSANPNHWAMTHSSITAMDFNGQRQYLYCASGGVVSVAADDGRILWQYPGWKVNLANVPSPIVIGDRIFLTGGYDAGCLMLQVKEEAGALSVAPVFQFPAKVFGTPQQTPILYHDHLFGIRADGQLVCLDLNGKLVWESGPKNKFGNGPLMIAQEMIFAMNDNGLLTLAEASTEKFTQLAQAKVLDGPDAWAPMALADGRLVLRDANRMICLDVRKQ